MYFDLKQLPNPPNNDDEEHVDVFNKVESENIQLDTTKSTAIAAIMSNIKLNENAIPDWAKVIPEEIWKNNLLENLNVRQTTLFLQKEKNEMKD